ncbi:hypothetical protein DOTSEDRAFT_71909 [Dothistroma septosporum NZE10]|uniref:PLL-like beta propeller domain-containing protein n=1 Tax=Dothistroma septosporum (strain NZE10 / CBS 128990) TaxID=675120 RepID=N1PL56_DOTSN|nr:hypothetical protein DOTSEDRAFT_71909 [Dothistroma septosporum NZE10]
MECFPTYIGTITTISGWTGTICQRTEALSISQDHPPQQAGGTGRIDVVSRDEDGKYLHLYYNSNDEGGEWTGWEDHWNSPKEFSTDPVIIAPEEGHFDVFGRLSNGTIAHLYWNGEEYSGWTLLDWKAPEHGWGLSSSLTASTWKNGSWDLWTLDAEGSLWHTFWRGAPVNEFFAWENITDRQQFNVTPNVVHWSAGHTDISGVENGTFYHKSWDGSGWTKWNAFGEGFASLPEVVSWGEGQYAVFGIDGDGLLWGAMYVDGYWKDWEKLEDVTPGDEQQVRPGRAVDSGGQYVLEGYKQGL